VTGPDLVRAVLRRRGLLAAGLVAAAVATALPRLAPDPLPTTLVLVAARDLPAGAALATDDLASAALPRDLVPSGALAADAEPVGRLVASAVRRGEPLTDVRLVGAGLLTGLAAGLVAVPVRLADPGTAALLRPGDAVDVLAAPTTPDGAGTGTAQVVAARTRVLAVPAAEAQDDGALVVLATSPATAARLAAAAVTSRLSVTVWPP
jgi:pilus assembly protein CpaB